MVRKLDIGVDENAKEQYEKEVQSHPIELLARRTQVRAREHSHNEQDDVQKQRRIAQGEVREAGSEPDGIIDPEPLVEGPKAEASCQK